MDKRETAGAGGQDGSSEDLVQKEEKLERHPQVTMTEVTMKRSSWVAT